MADRYRRPRRAHYGAGSRTPSLGQGTGSRSASEQCRAKQGCRKAASSSTGGGACARARAHARRQHGVAPRRVAATGCAAARLEQSGSALGRATPGLLCDRRSCIGAGCTRRLCSKLLQPC